jgi:hypothetical protein
MKEHKEKQKQSPLRLMGGGFFGHSFTFYLNGLSLGSNQTLFT